MLLFTWQLRQSLFYMSLKVHRCKLSCPLLVRYFEPIQNIRYSKRYSKCVDESGCRTLLVYHKAWRMKRLLNPISGKLYPDADKIHPSSIYGLTKQVWNECVYQKSLNIPTSFSLSMYSLSQKIYWYHIYIFYLILLQ